MSSKEKNYKKIMIITIVTSIIVVLGTVSYAFYQTAINGRVLGTMAEWSFTANDHVDSLDLYLGELYPGRSGTYNITLSAANSDLDVYYEMIVTYPTVGYTINRFMYWDSSYTKPLAGYVGRYGVIPKGTVEYVTLFLNWPYDGVDTYQSDLVLPEIKIMARQYTGYSGSIPMNLLGFTNLISYNEFGNDLIIPVSAAAGDQYGYSVYNKYKFEAINATSGYILNGRF